MANSRARRLQKLQERFTRPGDAGDPSLAPPLDPGGEPPGGDARRPDGDGEAVEWAADSENAAPASEQPGGRQPLDWADRIFHEFGRLYTQRPMYVAMAVSLQGEPELAVLRARVAALCDEFPRLRLGLDEDEGELFWSQDTDFDVERHVVDRVEPGFGTAGDLLSGYTPHGALQRVHAAAGGSVTSPWLIECVRDHTDASKSRAWGLRISFDHTLTDAEGMALLLGRLSDIPDETETVAHAMGVEPEPGGRSRSPLADRLAAARSTREGRRRHEHAGRRRPLRVGAGSSDVTWTAVDVTTSRDALEKAAQSRGTPLRHALVAISALALFRYRRDRAEEDLDIPVLVPSYSARLPGEELTLGNHRRSGRRFVIRPGAEIDEVLADLGRQEARKAITYGNAERLSAFPDRLRRAILSRWLPPVIVNWDANGALADIRRIGDVEVTDVAVAAPLLPHQQCSFIWWSSHGDLRCGLNTDADLVGDAGDLAAGVTRCLTEFVVGDSG